MVTPGVSLKIKTKKEAKVILKQLKALTGYRVLVGVPEENDPRETGEKIGNAGLAYIHDNGSPLRGIPARPFMRPGIAKAQRQISINLKIAAAALLDGTKEGVLIALNTAGMIAQNSIRNVILAGEGFAPLKRSTLLGRLRRRKGLSMKYKKPGMKAQKEEFLGSLKPLIDTAEMLKSISYIVEEPSND